ncbi:MAG: ChrR family anti-sigma-E factor [Pseudomonadota bacterium]
MTTNRSNWQEAGYSTDGCKSPTDLPDGLGAEQQIRVMSAQDEHVLSDMVHHHPDDLLLMDYATGALGEAESLVIATHAALCPLCRRKIAEFEAVGGAALGQLEAAQMGDDALAGVMARLDKSLDASMRDGQPTAAGDPSSQSSGAQSSGAQSSEAIGDMSIPQPLRGYLKAALEDLPWQNVLRGMDEVSLQVGSNDMVRTKMMRIQPGAAMPQHTHEGAELTLVLKGAFADERGHFQRGDLAFTDSDVEHRPIADDHEVCYCLAVTTAPLRLTGPIGRLINPFIKY